MAKNSKIKSVGEVSSSEKFVVKNSRGQVEKIIFPHTIQVGLGETKGESVFPSNISGSIQVTRTGDPYLVGRNGIRVTSASNGQITLQPSHKIELTSFTGEADKNYPELRYRYSGPPSGGDLYSPPSEGQTLGALTFYGWDDNSQFVSGSAITARAAEDWDETTAATQLEFYVRRTGHSNQTLGMRLDPDRRLKIGPMNSAGVATRYAEIDGGILTLYSSSVNMNSEPQLKFIKNDSDGFPSGGNFGEIQFIGREGGANTKPSISIFGEANESFAESTAIGGLLTIRIVPNGSTAQEDAVKITSGDGVMMELDGNLAQDEFHTEGHQYRLGEDISVGDCLVLSGNLAYKSSRQKQKNVCGLAWYSVGINKVERGFDITREKSGQIISKPYRDSLGLSYEKAMLISGSWTLSEDYKKIWKVASVGDSRQINNDSQQEDLMGFKVCNEGGAISQGDLLCTSSTPGYLMKQDDDIIKSYTVGKSMQDVEFDESGQATGVYGYIYCG